MFVLRGVEVVEYPGGNGRECHIGVVGKKDGSSFGNQWAAYDDLPGLIAKRTPAFTWMDHRKHEGVWQVENSVIEEFDEDTPEVGKDDRWATVTDQDTIEELELVLKAVRDSGIWAGRK